MYDVELQATTEDYLVAWNRTENPPSLSMREQGLLCQLVNDIKSETHLKSNSDAITMLQLLDTNQQTVGSRRPEHILLCVEQWSLWKATVLSSFWLLVCIVTSALYGVLSGVEKAYALGSYMATLGGLFLTLLSIMVTISK